MGQFTGPREPTLAPMIWQWLPLGKCESDFTGSLAALISFSSDHRAKHCSQAAVIVGVIWSASTIRVSFSTGRPVWPQPQWLPSCTGSSSDFRVRPGRVAELRLFPAHRFRCRCRRWCLARVGEHVELVGGVAADIAGVRLNSPKLQLHSGEDALIASVHFIVGDVGLIQVKE